MPNLWSLVLIVRVLNIFKKCHKICKKHNKVLTELCRLAYFPNSIKFKTVDLLIWNLLNLEHSKIYPCHLNSY